MPTGCRLPRQTWRTTGLAGNIRFAVPTAIRKLRGLGKPRRPKCKRVLCLQCQPAAVASSEADLHRPRDSAMKTRKMTLLVVDDDPSILRLISRVLERRYADRFSSVAFEYPRDAVRWLEQHCCDLVFSDIEMPELDGLEVMRLAKRRNAWTQVVFITGNSTFHRLSEAVEGGAADYILKPIRTEELDAVLEQQYARFARWESAVARTLAARKAALAP